MARTARNDDLAPPCRALVFDILALQDRAGPRGGRRPPGTPDGERLYADGQRLLDDARTSELDFHCWLVRLYTHVRRRLEADEIELGPAAADLWASVEHLLQTWLPPPEPQQRRRPGAAARIGTAVARSR
jgi:hypothetical protein